MQSRKKAALTLVASNDHYRGEYGEAVMLLTGNGEMVHLLREEPDRVKVRRQNGMVEVVHKDEIAGGCFKAYGMYMQATCWEEITEDDRSVLENTREFLTLVRAYREYLGHGFNEECYMNARKDFFSYYPFDVEHLAYPSELEEVVLKHFRIMRETRI